MTLKRAIASTTFCLSALLGVTSVFAADAVKPVNQENVTADQKITDLQHQVDELRTAQKEQQAETQKAVDKNKGYVLSSKCPNGKCEYRTSAVGFGTYFKKDDNYSGSNLISALPSTRTDIAILKRAYNEKKEAQELGAPEPSYPRVTLGSKLEVTGEYDHSRSTPGSAFLSAADLMAYFQVNPWVPSSTGSFDCRK